MPDTFNFSGEFKDTFINIQSTLRNVQQTVGQMSGSDEAARQQLKDLIGQLSKELEKAPAPRQEQAEAVAQTAQALVQQASAPKPNKTVLQINGDSLKLAAKNLSDVMPAVLGIATQIVLAIAKVTGGLP
jgi:hypothetical protein